MGAKLDSALHQAGVGGSSTGTENLGQRHPIWSDEANKTGSDVREGLGSQSNQYTIFYFYISFFFILIYFFSFFFNINYSSNLI